MKKKEFAKILREFIDDFRHYKYMTEESFFRNKKLSLYDFMEWLNSLPND